MRFVRVSVKCNGADHAGYKRVFGYPLARHSLDLTTEVLSGAREAMATTSSSRPAARKPATTRRKSQTRRRPAASTTTSTQPKTPVEQAQLIAERAVLVPVGASLLARDNLVSTVKG